MGRKPKALGRSIGADTEKTRADLMRAARECFAETGFRSTSNKQIAERGGIAAPTIYYYFKSKKDLFLAVHDEVQGQLLSVAQKAIAEANSFTDGWIEMSREMHDILKEDPSIAKFNSVVRTEAMRNPEISQALFDREWRDIFHKLADLAVKSGEISPPQRQELRAVLATINFGLNQHSIEAPPEVHARSIQGLIKLLRGELIKPEKTRR